eukprot:CAMPEP_0194028322 /NCGR_PEP_ID=MMETSP0009_2-20130614/2322_1 /TAXON_ID=210454 /ORGANISM="Grammatophora oceanica, Strain CCMP 410" /LENGTH=189 /DNA_ID=CAMNT_0038667675 /DNA_START=176 /DNA_END=745 /DNA_ORIENTATION=-
MNIEQAPSTFIVGEHHHSDSSMAMMDAVTVSTESDLHDDADMDLVTNQGVSRDTLETLRIAWNQLDHSVYANGYHSLPATGKRKQYLQDMKQLRIGREAYFSLGGDDRRDFCNLFATLRPRRVQDAFMDVCAHCLHENRMMQERDLVVVELESQGKREGVKDDQHERQQRNSKRQRETYFWLEGIHCFE